MNEVSENSTHITADKLEGPMAGKQLSDYLTAGANGSLYINIHTERNPNGEIRGQSEEPISPKIKTMPDNSHLFLFIIHYN